ncbi:reverse transcriptase domain-containing protein [Tanacetum coccineum]|uniref:Reverse transcriptase domain-containing protein n=1 Tax=Tanacetum coccineum TaxID=301880 RepID=A0ABQ4XVT1_9ASTR
MKEMRDGCNSYRGPHPLSKCDDKPMGGPKEEEADYAYRGYREGGYQGNYYAARNEHVNAVFTWSGKTYDPPDNPNAKTTIIHDDNEDEVDEAKKEVESSSSKQTKSNPPLLKAYKPKIPYPQRLRKEKMEERYAKFIDLITEVRINVPLVDVLSGMPNYGKFLKDLVSNKIECLALADLGTSINMMPYSLYILLSEITLKPMRMSIRLANHTYQYPLGVSKNMLVQVGKFIFLVDFVILQMEEDDKVPLILGRPFLHTTDAIIRVKIKELNLGVGDDRITFLINKAMQHSHLNDDTCFRTDVIDEVTEEELDALLNDSEPFLNTSEKINETSLDKEFEELMAVDVEEIPKQEEEVKNNFKELTLEGNLKIKTSIQEPPTDLEMKPLRKHLEYAFLEKDSLLPVVISALLKYDERNVLFLFSKCTRKHLLGNHLIFWALAHIFANIKSNSRMMPNVSFKDNVNLTRT